MTAAVAAAVACPDRHCRAGVSVVAAVSLAAVVVAANY